MNRVGMSNESGLNEMGLASKLLTQNVLYDIYLKLFYLNYSLKMFWNLIILEVWGGINSQYHILHFVDIGDLF